MRIRTWLEVAYSGHGLFSRVLSKNSYLCGMKRQKSVLRALGIGLGVFVLLMGMRALGANYGKVKPMENREVATFGMGCFWCSEAIFSRIDGVLKVQSGFSGGTVPNPSYRLVCEGNTGHAEVVQVEFDPTKVQYAELLKVFFTMHDPTTLNRQGADVGTQYRSVIFTHSPEQKRLANEAIAQLTKEGVYSSKIVTQVVDFQAFYPAENYHDDYFARNSGEGYCRLVIQPKVEKFEKAFSKLLKKK